MRRVRRIVDLSHPLDDGTQVFPGDPAVSLTPVATVARDGYNLLGVRMGSQSGTHVDAPRHFFRDGAGVDALDLTLFCGPAVVADVRGLGPPQPITWADLGPVCEQLIGGVILVLETGWSKHWRTETYFEHPYLDRDAAERVVAAGVRTIGIDAPSLDETVLEEAGAATCADNRTVVYPAHRAVLGAGGAIVENLTNLAAVDFPDPLVSVLPLRLTDGDGAPVRAVAMEVG